VRWSNWATIADLGTALGHLNPDADPDPDLQWYASKNRHRNIDRPEPR